MSFFSDERANELRDLFFESAQELLQTLNDEGLQLEKSPGDAETIRSIRRTVHTLKGDSAACGFRDLSELAHELEDILTPELAARTDGATAQVVLSAADVFDAMLSAHRANSQPPDGSALREMIKGLLHKPAEEPASSYVPGFVWTEYERLIIDQGVDGKPVYNVGVQFDPKCAMKAAAVQLVRNVLSESGKILVSVPDENTLADTDTLEAVVSTDRDADWIAGRCRIPTIVSTVVVKPLEFQVQATATAETPDTPEADVPAAVEADNVLEIPPVPAFTQSEPAHSNTPVPTATENILRVDAERIDAVLNLVGELIIGKSMMHQTIAEFTRRFPKDPLRSRFADMMAYQSQVMNELQRSVMKIRMVPVEQLFRRFPRVVRDVGKIRGKEVELEISGQDTDLDKSILDALAEPLTHMVRNSVDHGLEGPAERVACGKPAQGKVRLNAYHQGNHVVIEVADDGRGIDVQKVMTKAIERNVVTAEQASRMTDTEITQLIFEPGFSTADEVTEVSGRGIGLDIVKSVLERMKGSVEVQSTSGEGTTFLLKVPLTLAIIRALLFRVAERLYAVPLASVIEIARAAEEDIHRVDGHEVLQLRSEVVTLVRVGRLHHIENKTKRLFVIVVTMADRKFGLIVDRLAGEEELVIKAMDDHLIATDLVSGASILGDGTVVLILNIAAVVERLGKERSVPLNGSAKDLAGTGDIPARLMGANA